MKSFYLKAKKFLQKHERLLLPVSLIIGFIIDSFTLTRIDKLFDNLILIGYLLIAGGSIILIFGLGKPKRELGFTGKFQTFLPYILQYAFGGLFSGLFIFYFKSATLVTNFPFLIVLLFLLIGNEFFHRRSLRLLFWVTVFSVALISYSVLIFPVLVGSISTLTFIGGSLIGLVLVVLYIKMIGKFILKDNTGGVKKFYKTASVVYIIFMILYATNSIPPVPLSVKTEGVFHQIQRNGDTYTAIGEKKSWYTPFRESNKIYHLVGDQPAYVFSSIFAPTKISGTIYHQWSYFDGENGWIEAQRVPINISGGREEGFRGYSWSSVYEGLWRVDIENAKGQVAGRLVFRVEESDGDLNLESKTY